MENQTQTQTEPNQTKNLEKGFSSKNLFLLERDKELKQLMYAMLIGEHVFLQGDAGTGKCHAKGTEIIMADGSLKKVEEIKVGDEIMGDDSTPRKVLSLASGKEEMFKITPNKGEPFIVNKSHNLSLKASFTSSIAKKGDVITVPLFAYIHASENKKRSLAQSVYKLHREKVSFPRKTIKLNPYYLGLWLGDGTSRESTITTADKEVKEFLHQYAYLLKLQVTERKEKGTKAYRVSITSGKTGGNQEKNSSLKRILKEEGLLQNKHIPFNYKCNCEHNRLKLLAGLIDSDGYYDKKNNGFEFANKNRQLCEDVLFLCRSLGFGAYLKERTTTCLGKSFKSYRIYISGDVKRIPCLIERKKAGNRKQKKDVLVTGFSVKKLRKGEYYGFNLDGNKLYLTKDFIVHHNSMLAKHAFSLVQNAKLFAIQMSEATLSEHLFGAYDIPTWKDKGFLMRDITGSILEADFAFIDEIFDGREDVLRTLLGILNERKFIEGRQQEDALLHTAVATANYQSINEKTIPILDRFLFKSIVKPLKSKSNKIKMYSQHLAKTGGKLSSYPIKPILDLKQLKDFTDRVYSDEVIISDEVLEVYDELITEYEKEINVKKKKYISSRTSNKLLDIVKAAVLLDGRQQAVFTDLFEVRYGLCTMNDDEDEKTFDKVYKRCVEGLEDEKNQIAEITKLENELKLDTFKNVTLQANEFIERLKALTSAQKKLSQMAAINDKVDTRRKDFMNKLKTSIDETKQKLMFEVEK